MDDARREVELAGEAFLAAIVHLRTQLDRNEELMHRALDHFRAGATMASTMTDIPSADARAAAQDAVRDFYARKNRLRVAVTNAALAEGLSVAEIATAFTIPHGVVAAISAEFPRVDVS